MISGNDGSPTLGAGVRIFGSAATGNVVAGNYIGVNAAGTGALANTGSGVRIDFAATNNTIGGPASGQGNTIAFNSSEGVVVAGAGTTGDAIRGNSIFSNTGLGIDLGGSGVIIPNDSQGHSGPDDFADFPVIQSVTSGPSTVVSGTLQSTPSTIEYLDFYANTTPNASGHGDAQVYLGSETVTTDSTGLAQWSAGGLGATSSGQYITVTATDQNGNTSEFASNVQPAAADNPPAVTIIGPVSMPAPGIPVALGSTLTDSAGKTYTYAWNVTSTTDPSFALPAGVVTTEPNLTFTPSEPGTFVATLSVMDNLGAVGKATPLTITVGSGVQTVGIKGDPTSTAVNVPVTLSAAGNEPQGVMVISYAWSVTEDGSPYTLPSGTITNASTFTFTPTTAGNYVVTLTETNSAGSTSSASVSFLAIVPSVTIVGRRRTRE